MILYAISGLGADERVFSYLSLNHELKPVKWMIPQVNETLEEYSLRLSMQIDEKEKFGIIGVSFGGLIAVELSKILHPELTFLISSAETKMELRKVYRILGKIKILQYMPERFFNVPRRISEVMFGAKNKDLLNQIIEETNLKFTKWAVTKLAEWKNSERIENCLKISGENDKLMPATKDLKTVLVKGGQHFMIVDNADEISRIINKTIEIFLHTKKLPQHF
jgi:hypothetical protein